MTIRTIKNKLKKARMSMMCIYLYGIGLIILFILIISAWILAWTQGRIEQSAFIQLLMSFFDKYTATPVIAAVAFVSIFSINKDKNGESDIAEKKAQEGNVAINNIKTIGNTIREGINARN